MPLNRTSKGRSEVQRPFKDASKGLQCVHSVWQAWDTPRYPRASARDQEEGRKELRRTPQTPPLLPWNRTSKGRGEAQRPFKDASKGLRWDHSVERASNTPRHPRASFRDQGEGQKSTKSTLQTLPHLPLNQAFEGRSEAQRPSKDAPKGPQCAHSVCGRLGTHLGTPGHRSESKERAESS